MAGDGAGRGQTRATDRDGMRLENHVFERLRDLLPTSIATRTELGAVVCRARDGGLSDAEVKVGLGNTVDIGQREPNCGCPAGTTPVAFWHTHPVELFGTGPGTMHGEADFSPPDLDIADDLGIPAFLGSWDGHFRRYDPVPRKSVALPGGGSAQVLRTDAEGNVVKEVRKPSTVLPRMLPTSAPRAHRGPGPLIINVAPPR
ncbi:DUF4329 domain-containing protein [Roseomonas sp. CCTCC AB2023176]|uniref:DUF4329 domain-containing protein n=1 Tax=Roseomonas sp. CCTCC AB2023176 TaxID=3342640 RepID=UPI0035DB5FEF